jgi:hypothetical protein
MCHHNAAMAKSWLKITVRMPPALHAKLTEATGDHMPPNSLNTEIIERLDRSFEQEEVLLGYVRTEMKEIDPRLKADLPAMLAKSGKAKK